MKGLENAIRNLNSLDNSYGATGQRMGDKPCGTESGLVATRQATGIPSGDKSVKGIP